MNAAIYELIGAAEFVIDAEGQKKAVMLDFSAWEDLLNLLEDIEDSAEIESIRAGGEKPVPWEKAKTDLSEKTAQENLQIYRLAREYLLSFDGTSEEMLDAHLTEWRTRKPGNIRGLFRAMIEHAQNRQGRPNSIGNIDRLGELLFDFDPHLVAKKYEGWKDIFDAIARSAYRPSGRFDKTNAKSIWVQYCKSILSCAKFLADFRDLDEFDRFIEGFYANEHSRIELPFLIEKKVFGFGFPLACDFLKGVGYPEFIKTDVHIIEIARGVGISTGKRDVDIFRDVIKFCRSIDKLPYEVDKLFWLIGSGKFYLYNKKVRSSREEFIRRVRYELPRFANDIQE